MAQYELQERCGKSAREFFQKEYGNGGGITKDGVGYTSFENHYNAKLNKCFIETEGISVMKGIFVTFRTLVDINAHKEYAKFIQQRGVDPYTCEVEGVNCRSETEWKELIKPYMSD